MTDATPAPLADVPTGSAIRTDRPCARCGFNLFGQTIVREPHYGLVAVRCPECGQLAALQEYPALGKWAVRWARTLAAMWILVLLGSMFFQFLPMFGLSMGLIEIATDEHSYPVLAEYTADETRTAPMGVWSDLDPAWWADNRERLTDGVGLPLGVVTRKAAAVWFPIAVLSAGFGAFWSVMCFGGRRRWAVLASAVPAAGAVSMAFYVDAADAMVSAPTIRNAVGGVVRPALLVVTLGVSLVPLLLGVWLGRPLSRLLVRLALPPRMRAPLSFLWTRDGLEPPRPTAV